MPVYALIGFPLTHSFSKAFFSSKFEREGLTDHQYLHLEIENLSQLKEVIKYHQLDGFNVTIPYKEKIISLLDEVTDEAKSIAAVNVVKVNTDKKLSGHNTDYPAFLETIKPFLKPYHTSALILGTGGASKAVACALKSLDIEFKFVSRYPLNSQTLHYAELTAKDIRNSPVIINASPVGTFPATGNSPDIPYEGIDKFHLVYDLVYNPAETVFLKKAGAFGARTVNGHAMLIRQAELSWAIWKDQVKNAYL